MLYSGEGLFMVGAIFFFFLFTFAGAGHAVGAIFAAVLARRRRSALLHKRVPEVARTAGAAVIEASSGRRRW